MQKIANKRHCKLFYKKKPKKKSVNFWKRLRDYENQITVISATILISRHTDLMSKQPVQIKPE